MKISSNASEISDGQMRRYGSMVGFCFLLAILAFGASYYLQIPFASFSALVFVLVLSKVSFLHWERWFWGKDADARVTEALKALLDDYVFLNDLVLPDSKGNIDHLLVGPNGLFVIETMKYSGYVKCDEDRWFVNGHALRSLSKQAKRNSLAVRSSIGSLFTAPGKNIPYVAPVLVFVGSQTKLKLVKPTLPVLRLREIVGFIRDYQAKQIITEAEKRSIVYHLQSLQPGYEDRLDLLEAAENDNLKIA